MTEPDYNAAPFSERSKVEPFWGNTIKTLWEWLKRECAETRLISWFWLALAMVSVIIAANMFRYETYGMTGSTAFEASHVYDRWEKRVCIVIPFRGIACTAEDFPSK